MATTYTVGDKTKNNIINESRKLFYKKGYKDTTYTDISKAADVNRALIPYHFKSKELLGATIYDLIINDTTDKADSLLDTEDLSSDLSGAFHVVVFFRMFENEHFADFISEVYDACKNDLYDIDIEKKLILSFDSKFAKLNDKTISLLSQSMASIRLNLIRNLKKDDYTADDLAKHYINMLLHYIGYSEKKINELTDAAISLADLIDINISTGFSVKVSYR
ncbi:MAG: TetR/AcrR family transcriptional regulator [Lachnospiraceae bacterium]|nr:TetR/AcrR family transcriptional regulator [Lachnospiraceae bacterium]